MHTFRYKRGEVGIQACLETTDASTEPMIEGRYTGVEDKVLESVIERKKAKTEKAKTERRKEKGKGKEGAKDRKQVGDTLPPTKGQKGKVMEDLDRYSRMKTCRSTRWSWKTRPGEPPITKADYQALGSVGKGSLPNTSQPPRQSTKMT